MKKITLAVAIFAAIITAGCSSTDKGNEQTAATAAPAPTATQGTRFAATTNIRYIDMDTILQSYTLAKELTAEAQKLMLDYQNLERSKGNELNTMGNRIQQKVNSSGYLTQESYQADVNSFNQKQSEAQNLLAQRQQQINLRVAEQQKRLSDTLTNFIEQYNATRHFDAILLREAGIYFNPELNITAEVVDALNARYAASQGK